MVDCDYPFDCRIASSSCDLACLVCTDGNPDSCTSCNNGYYLTGTTCEICSSSCSTCTS